MSSGTMKRYLRQAIFDALADLGDQNRELVIYHLQKDYGIKFADGCCPTVAEIELALRLALGSASNIFIKRFEMELEKHPIKLIVPSPKVSLGI